MCTSALRYITSFRIYNVCVFVFTQCLGELPMCKVVLVNRIVYICVCFVELNIPMVYTGGPDEHTHRAEPCSQERE